MQHEAQTLNKLSNIKSQMKQSDDFLKKACAAYCFFPVNTEKVIEYQQ